MAHLWDVEDLTDEYFEDLPPLVAKGTSNDEREQSIEAIVDAWFLGSLKGGPHGRTGPAVVLDRIAREFGIEDDLLLPSRSVFAEYGNMSSPSVLFCLEKLLAETPPRQGDFGLLLAFGAGFTSFAALVQFGGKG